MAAGLGIRIVFAGLVVATVVAFFATQRLKRTLPVVSGVRIEPKHFSPDRDGRADRVRLSFLIKRSDEVTVGVVARNGAEVRRLATDLPLSEGRRTFVWNGSNDSGSRAGDGVYHLRVGLRREGRTATSSRKIYLDRTPPRPAVASVAPGVVAPGSRTGRRLVRARIHGPAHDRPRLLIYRTGVGSARLVARAWGNRRGQVAYWDGLAGGRPAAPGNYLIAVQVRDAAGNVGSGPPRLPPRRGEGEGHPGVVVDYLSATGPDVPVAPGADARFRVRGPLGEYRWRVGRFGSGRTIARGVGRARVLAVRAPRGRPGVYVLGVRAGGRVARVPFAVRSARRRAVLVVLPVASWQASNPLDSNGDGWADLLGLPAGGGPYRGRPASVALGRPYPGGMPPGLRRLEGPLLEWLDREGLRYDVTTDLALERGTGPDIGGHRAAVFAGPELFPSRTLAGRIVRYLRRGGRVAVLGGDSFRRFASVTPRRISSPTPFRARNVFGERLAPPGGREMAWLGTGAARNRPAGAAGRARGNGGGPIAALEDDIGLFAGASASFGAFEQLEERIEPPPGARALATAGRASKRPSLVLYRVGRGLLFRSGSSDWNGNLDDSPSVARIMRRLWSLLSR